MARRSFCLAGWTPTAVLDAANFTDNGYQGLMGGSTTQLINIWEVMMEGMATASAPCPMLLARDSTVQATPTSLTTGQSDGPLHPSTAALSAPAVAFTASTTKPQRSATSTKLSLGLNAFGGLVRYQAPLEGPFVILGNTASFGEASLSCYTGGTPGLMASHIIYEPL